jgi:HK97 family phage major capsid protein
MAVLASTVKVTGEPDFLLDLDVDGTTGRVGYMAGFPVYVDKNISATEYLFGDFSNYGLGFFGSMEMAVDHEYDFAKGNIAIRTIQDFDGSVLTNSGFARCHT